MRATVRLTIALSFLAASSAVSANTLEVKDDHLVRYVVVDQAIPKSLTGKPGDPAKGKKVAIDRRLGNCLGCHTMPIPSEPDHGTVGTDLNGVGSRWSEGELRLRIVNPKLLNPETVMPAFYRVEGLHRVAKQNQDKPILSAEQVEDLVAYLSSLKQQ
jgi:sulfur-oxidizing protein SoxX